MKAADRKLAVLLAGALGALGLPHAAPAAPTLRAHLAQNLSPISGIVLVAEQEGFFARHGIDVGVSNFSSGKQCLNTVIAGAADIATTAETPVTAAMMADQPIAFLARMEYSDDETLVATAAHIRSWADLKGKRIGFTAGTGSEIYTYTLLAKAKLKPGDVTLVNLRPQDMAAALATGSIDAYDTWQPYINDGERVLGSKVALLDTAGVYSETFDIVVMQGYLKTHAALMHRFLAAMIEAEAWMKAHPAAAITVVAKTVGMKRAVLASIWSNYVFHVALDPKELGILKMNASWRLASGNHPTGVTALPDFARFIFPAPLRAVAPDRVTLPAVSWGVAAR
jgi:ABC-type nitrate/sulfonate/bicarbonate transport system substrate-binding protein